MIGMKRCQTLALLTTHSFSYALVSFPFGLFAGKSKSYYILRAKNLAQLGTYYASKKFKEFIGITISPWLSLEAIEWAGNIFPVKIFVIR
jgi:hypothetical protein